MNNITVDDEIRRMKHLMGFDEQPASLNESAHGTLEYHEKGADGNTYGIIRENNKYYIKVAPKKDTAVVLEDYDYIGGVANKKQYEYPSYSVASKNLNCKMASLNEAYANMGRIERPAVDHSPAPLTSAQAEEMRESIDKFYMQMYKMGLAEAKDKGAYIAAHQGDLEKIGKYEPFTEKPSTTEAGEHKDPKTADKTFSEKPTLKDIWHEALNDGKETPYTDKAKEPEQEGDAVANDTEKKGATIKITAKQQRAWNSAQRQKQHGAPYTEKLNEMEVKWEDTVGADDEEVEDDYDMIDDEFEADGSVESVEDAEKVEDSDMTLDDIEDNEEYTVSDEDIENIFESVMSEFGNHPGYRKKPFTTPKAKKICNQWTRDCEDNDESSEDVPFGRSKGNSDPYTEKAIDMIVDSILQKKK